MNVRASIIPENEKQRMAAVRRYDILDTPPDGAFDRITAIAARQFDVPISIISIVDEDRIWFKSHHGINARQIDREPGLCASAILSADPYLLPDASRDPRSLANPLVAGEMGLRFYVGVPLRTSDGFNLGTLCVIDKTPRPIKQKQIDDLTDLATVVMDQMELRLSARRAVEQANLMAREIDHRMMNSLQFVAGLLTLQSRLSKNPNSAQELHTAAGRVAAVARVHRHFYSGEATESEPCLTFLRRICDDLGGIIGAPIQVSGEEAEVPTTWLQPIGLLVSELVTNAAKHGNGLIEVSFDAAGGRHRIVVRDDGNGLPPGFDPQAGQGLGMKVIHSLVGQLHGSLTAGSNAIGRGARFEIVFPVE